MALRSKRDRHTQAYKKHILYNQVPTSIKLFIHIVIKFVPYQSTLGLMSLAARAVCSGVMVNGWLVERNATSMFLIFRISGISSVSPDIYTRKPSRVSMKPLSLPFG